MYIPKAFQVDDTGIAIEFMRSKSFATIVTSGAGGLVASHVPVIVSTTGATSPALHCHLARANPHWRQFDGTTEALVIFQGPHGYVSPSLYETHPSVPTWNYQAVHAYGVPAVVEDPQATREHVLALVQQYEAGSPEPWTPDLPEDVFQGLLRQIVAVRIEVNRIETKFKLGQNRPLADRENMASAFEASANTTLRELGEATRATLDLVG